MELHSADILPSNSRSVKDIGTWYCPPKYEVPRDEIDPDYVKSFTTEQVSEYKEFFNKFGFVIIREILSKEEAAATVDDIWNYVETRGWLRSKDEAERYSKIKRNDPSTWDNYWPAMAEEGIVANPPTFTKQALRNRQNPRVYKVFAELYGRGDLLVNHDRYGLFRPTKNVNFRGNITDMNPWKTFFNIHLDMNPWYYIESSDRSRDDKILNNLTYPSHGADFIEENNYVGVAKDNELHLQGLINLADNKPEDGGFQLVPGFANHLAEFAKVTAPRLKSKYGNRSTFIVLRDNEPFISHAIRLSARAGSLIIWDQRTAHGSAPNNTTNARYAQFLKLFPAIDLNIPRAVARSSLLKVKVENADFTSELTDLGKKLFGFEKW